MENGDPVCNPCGLYYKLNGVSREKEKERERERERERGQCIALLVSGWGCYCKLCVGELALSLVEIIASDKPPCSGTLDLSRRLA